MTITILRNKEAMHGVVPNTCVDSVVYQSMTRSSDPCTFLSKMIVYSRLSLKKKQKKVVPMGIEPMLFAL